MEGELVAAAAGLVGALVGGGITLITSRQQLDFQGRSELRRVYVDKLEAAYESLSKVKDGAANLQLASVASIAHGLDFKSQLKERIPTDRAELLVSFYAPALRRDVEHMNAAWLRFSGSIAEAVVGHKLNGDQKGDLLIKLVEQGQQIGAMATRIQQRLAEDAAARLSGAAVAGGSKDGVILRLINRWRKNPNPPGRSD